MFGFGNEAGTILLSGVSCLALLVAALLLLLALFRREQAEIALRFRLETCALEALAERRQLLHKIVALNRTMIPLQALVYAGRAGRAVPGVGVVSHAAAEAALFSLRGLAEGRAAMISFAAIQERMKLLCRAGRFSRELAHCRFSVFQREMLRKDPVAYADVPATVSLSESARRSKFTCSSYPHSEGLILVGDPKLLQTNFKHSYENEP